MNPLTPQKAAGRRSWPSLVEVLRGQPPLLARYRRLIAVVLTADAVVLVATAVLYGLFGLKGAAGERGLLTTAGSAQLLAAGLLSVAAFARNRKQRSAFWLVLGLGLIAFAADDYATVHERAGGWAADQGAYVLPFVNSADDMLTLTYGLAGLLMLFTFRRQVLAPSAPATLLLAGAGMAGLMLAVDAVGHSVLQVIENPAQLFAGGFLLLAAIVHWRETGTRAASDERSGPGKQQGVFTQVPHP